MERKFPGMSESGQNTSGNSWNSPLLHRLGMLQQREDQVFLVLTLVIGALTGLAVVAFILLTERVGMRLYPPGGARWRRLLFPVAGSLRIGYLLFRYFPNARGSGVPQTKAALYAREGRITLRTVLGKFFCTSATLASGIPLGREGPSVQVGAGIASVLGRLLDCARKGEGAAAGWCGSSHCRSIQYSSGGRGVCARRDCRGPSCTAGGISCAGIGHFLGGASPYARQ